jgi:hypothetical protein
MPVAGILGRIGPCYFSASRVVPGTGGARGNSIDTVLVTDRGSRLPRPVQETFAMVDGRRVAAINGQDGRARDGHGAWGRGCDCRSTDPAGLAAEP